MSIFKDGLKFTKGKPKSENQEFDPEVVGKMKREAMNAADKVIKSMHPTNKQEQDDVYTLLFNIESFIRGMEIKIEELQRSKISDGGKNVFLDKMINQIANKIQGIPCKNEQERACINKITSGINDYLKKYVKNIKSFREDKKGLER